MARKKNENNSKQSASPRQNRPLNPEEAELWQHVTKSVTPIQGKKPAAKEKPSKAPLKKPAVRQEAPLPPYRPSAAPAAKKAGLDPSTATRIKKGKIAPEGTIDLHGMTQDEAFATLRRFIAAAQRQEKRTLLVITGKGRLATGGGVLRRMLPLWVGSGELSDAVIDCLQASDKDGGSGAFYLRLRKKT